MKLIMLVFGTRPEAIKMAPLYAELKKYPDKFKVIVTVTGQHRQMLDQVLEIFNILPDYDLDIMKSNQDLFDITTNVLLGMREILSDIKPDIVLVHGDTTTSTAAALAAFYYQIKVGHIEAGLRTNNIYSPWPEEMNRRLTSKLSTFHFSPTQLSKDNLINENINEPNIFVTGNTVVDALKIILKTIEKSPKIITKIKRRLIENGIQADLIEKWLHNERRMVLITGHRRENFGSGFINICEAIKELSEKYSDVDFVYPMHMNPNVRLSIQKVFYGKLGEKINTNAIFTEPFDYLPFVYLMSICNIILTDSGGIQEEAPALGKPVLVMRETSERPEAIKSGNAILVGVDKKLIISKTSELLDCTSTYLQMTKINNPYGDGNACKIIVKHLLKLLNN